MNHGDNFKTVIALSQAFDGQLPAQLNALGHLAQSIGHQTAHRRLGHFTSYHDAAGAKLGYLSWWPVIILAGRPQKIADFWSSLQPHDWPRACFTDTMIRGGSETQLAETAAKKLEEGNIIAVGAFGPDQAISALTKKLSLWRGPSTANLRPVVAA